jgi:cytochrome c biogenesis protein CcdA
LLYGALFVGGFLLLFVLAALPATALGAWVRAFLNHLQRVGGVLLILLALTVLVPVSARNDRRGFEVSLGGAALVAGAGVAAAWTPCIGTTLSTILFLGQRPETIGSGILHLVLYGLGLGLALTAVSIVVGQAIQATSPRQGREAPALESGAPGATAFPAGGRFRLFAAGLLFVAGVLLLTGHFALWTAPLARFSPLFQLGS